MFGVGAAIAYLGALALLASPLLATTYGFDLYFALAVIAVVVAATVAATVSWVAFRAGCAVFSRTAPAITSAILGFASALVGSVALVQLHVHGRGNSGWIAFGIGVAVVPFLAARIGRSSGPNISSKPNPLRGSA